MDILYLLIPIALGILALAIKMLFWAIKSGQYDDLDAEGQRILFDDERPIEKTSPNSTSSESSFDNKL